MTIGGKDSFGTARVLKVGDTAFAYRSLAAAEAAGIGAVSRLPASLKVLLENLLRWVCAISQNDLLTNTEKMS